MNEGDSIPLTLKTGIAYHFLDVPVILVCDAILPNDNNIYIGIGA